MKTLFSFLIILFLGFPVHACFIMVMTDGDCVLVANHEDWYETDSQIRIFPANASRYGSIIFTFASEGWAQGGMNEKGLFFDGARTPLDPIDFDTSLIEPDEYIWQTVLDKCATVEEAINLLKRYKLPELEQLHMVIADASGRSVIIGTDHGKITFYEQKGGHQIQTNFNKAQPELGGEPTCQRYATAQKMILEKGTCSKDNVELILAQTHQDLLTVYSNIYDLKKRTVTVYQHADFLKRAILNLDDLLSKGYQEIMIAHLFEEPVAENGRDKVLTGEVIDAGDGSPVAYANLGVFEKGKGTLSDKDGTFELQLNESYLGDTITFSALGYEPEKLPVSDLIIKPGKLKVKLVPKALLLEEVTVTGKALKLNKVKRWGWMKGRHGILPLDSAQGGAAVAFLVEAPETKEEFLLEKIWLRILYSSEDSFQFRLRLHEVDSTSGLPGTELLERSILLKESKRIGWEKIDLSPHYIYIEERAFFVVLEWITSRSRRKQVMASLADWETWKKEQYQNGNPKVTRKKKVPENGREAVEWYEYKGDMRDWPGFADMPGLTALVVDDDVNEKNKNYRTYFRNQSLDVWKPVSSVLNAVVRIKY